MPSEAVKPNRVGFLGATCTMEGERSPRTIPSEGALCGGVGKA